MQVTEPEFFGMKFSSNGISISEHKLKALLEADPPKTPSEVVSFLGLALFCERFIKKLAIKAEPLRRLTHSKTAWIWTKEQQDAFELIKNSITTKSVGYFVLNKRTKLLRAQVHKRVSRSPQPILTGRYHIDFSKANNKQQ